MSVPIISEALQALNLINAWIPQPIKLLFFLAILLGGIVINIPILNINFFGLLELMVLAIGDAFGISLSIIGFIVIVFLAIPAIIALKHGRVSA